MKKLFIVVLYKENISQCKTLLSFKGIDLFKNQNNFFVIWDNSPGCENEKFLYKDFFCSNNIEYIHTPENISLAKIYNSSIKEHNADVYCIFDQDSEITFKNFDNYVDKVLDKNRDINIFLPQVFAGRKLFSPGKSFLSHGSHFNKLNSGIHKHRLYTAITSGMIVRHSVFFQKNSWFNEDLNLYGIDFDFFRKYRAIDSKFYLLNFSLNHDLSTFSLSNDEARQRVKMQFDAYLKIFRHNIFYPLVFLHFKFVRLKNAF